MRHQEIGMQTQMPRMNKGSAIKYKGLNHTCERSGMSSGSRSTRRSGVQSRRGPNAPTGPNQPSGSSQSGGATFLAMPVVERGKILRESFTFLI
eukprot:3312269-Amphidinium_carterae.1